MMAVGVYEIATMIRFSATFIDKPTGSKVDPGTVTFWIQDPCGEEQSFTSLIVGEVIRTGTGEYYCEFTPDTAGRWLYKWQGTAPAVVTSKDTQFIVNPTCIDALN